MLRSVGGWIAAGVLVGACSFEARSGNGPGAPVDAAQVDAAPIDAAPPGPRRKRISIKPEKVTGNQKDFPVWIALTDADLMQRASASGADIHFTKPDGSDLPYEVQRWVPATGRLEAWVRLDLADNAATELDLRYGDATRAHAPSPAEVFSSSFEAVWHLEDALTTTVVKNSAKANLPGTAQIGLGADDQVAGQLGGAIDFDGTEGEQIQFTNPYSGNSKHTISAWVYQRTATDSDAIVTVGNPAANQSRWFNSVREGAVMVGFYGNDWVVPSSSPVLGEWVLLHWVYDSGGGGRSRVYRNGAELGNTQPSSNIDTQGTNGQIGWASNQWGPGMDQPCGLNGILDEVRLSRTDRSAGWIATEYANQSAPETFYSVGPEQPAE